MPKFEIAVPHTLGRETALERVQTFSDKIQQRHGDKIKDFEQAWEGDRLNFGFKTMGMRIQGGLDVTEESVRVEGDLPFAAAMFKGQLTGAIQEQLQKLLA